MKIKIRTSAYFVVFSFGLFVFPSFGQTTKYEIRFNTIPASVPVCTTESKYVDKTTTLIRIFVPRVLDLIIPSSMGSYVPDGDNYVFSFKTGSGGQCVATSVGFEISLFGPSQSGSPDSGTNSGTGGGSQDPSPPSDPPNLVPLASMQEIAKEEEDAREDALDLSIPESPGFTILGLTPQDVTRPATPRAFATALLNSIDRSGNLQSGIAIDTVPYLLVLGDSVTLDKYKEKTTNGYLTRFLSRTQFSLATTKGTSENDKSARIGAGLHITFFDYGDPNLDAKLDTCFDDLDDRLRSQARSELGVGPGERPNEATQRLIVARMKALLSEIYKIEYKKCLEDSKKRNFMRSSFGVGGAGSWISTTGDTTKFTNNGAGIWTSLAYGFEGIPGLDQKSQLILHFRRRIKETVADPLNPGQFTKKDSNLFGIRLRIGVPDWTGNIEGVYQGEHFAGKAPETNFRLSFGTDYKIASNVYLNFSIGGETKKSNISENKVFVRTSFNFGTSSKPLQPE